MPKYIKEMGIKTCSYCNARLDFSSSQDVKRFILGTFDSHEDVHKRPLTKLVQDVAKQLGII